jgi:hypothetical protein
MYDVDLCNCYLWIHLRVTRSERVALNQRGENIRYNGGEVVMCGQTKRKEHWNIVVMYTYMIGCMIDMDV